MKLSLEFFFRIIGAVLFSIGGAYLGAYLGAQLADAPDVWGTVFFLVGALVGLIGTPYITTRPARAIRDLVASASRNTLIAGGAGVLVGVLIGALLTGPLSQLPPPIGNFAPFIAVIILAWLGATIGILRANDIAVTFASMVASVPARPVGESSAPIVPGQLVPGGNYILLDTSVLIDGRIVDICQTGFINSTLVVPRFVLNELQYIADSADALRRNRGRRGLEMLSRLQRDTLTPVQITDLDIESARQVDDKLVLLGKQLRCPILTNDYNLNRVAEIQSVQVLNINDLANAVRVVLLPGETLAVKVIQEGKEHGQGIGYLDDGTMVVIDDGRRSMNKEVTVTVTKVLQTTAGRMIFARQDEGDASPAAR